MMGLGVLSFIYMMPVEQVLYNLFFLEIKDYQRILAYNHLHVKFLQLQITIFLLNIYKPPVLLIFKSWSAIGIDSFFFFFWQKLRYYQLEAGGETYLYYRFELLTIFSSLLFPFKHSQCSFLYTENKKARTFLLSLLRSAYMALQFSTIERNSRFQGIEKPKMIN